MARKVITITLPAPPESDDNELKRFYEDIRRALEDIKVELQRLEDNKVDK